jgi:hypothetical protein
MKLDYSGQNLIILNFNLFVSHYENLIIDDLIKYGLVESPLTNKDVKKLFYHHLIKIIVDEFIFSNKSVNRLVMVFNTETAIQGRLREYYGDRELINFLYRFINKLENMLPVRFVTIDKMLDEYSMVNECLRKVKKVSKKQYTFQKIKLFAKRYDLTFLNENYLNCIRTKQVLI